MSEISNDGSFDNEPNDIDEEKRTRLREIEVRIVQYQDELESGQRSLKSGWTMNQQIEHYRRKLMKKSDKDILMSISNVQEYESPAHDKYARKENKRSPSPSDIP